jgi:CheY-like chemotaxis protein
MLPDALLRAARLDFRQRGISNLGRSACPRSQMMKVLVADDDAISRRTLESLLSKSGYEVWPAGDGDEAWRMLQTQDAPRLAVLDWLMPNMDGVDVCRRARSSQLLEGAYLILVTCRGSRRHIVEGLQAGANDYVIKPFDNDELLARVNVGAQVIRLQSQLARQVCELEAALMRVTQLQQLLPICSYCKKIRDDNNQWHSIERFIESRCATSLSHGICPQCWQTEVEPQLQSKSP